MDSRAKKRLALTIAAALAVAALTAKPLYACENCPPGPNTAGVAANALPIYPEPTEEKAAEEKAAKPIALKKFTKSQTRTTRHAQSRESSLSQRARDSKSDARKTGETEQDERDAAASVGKAEEKKVTPAVANANAELIGPEATEPEVAKPNTTEAGEPAALAAAESQSEAVQPPAVELVSAEEFNDLDRAAWQADQMPRLMQLTASDSRAELRDHDSSWAQTSTIGKLFVAFGALLTIGSALRMFMA